MQAISDEAARDILANAFNVRGDIKKPAERERFMLKIARAAGVPAIKNLCVALNVKTEDGRANELVNLIFGRILAGRYVVAE